MSPKEESEVTTPDPLREARTQLDLIEEQADRMAEFPVTRDDETLAKTFRTAARKARAALDSTPPPQERSDEIPNPGLTREEAEALAYGFQGDLPRDEEMRRREQEWRQDERAAIDKLRSALARAALDSTPPLQERSDEIEVRLTREELTKDIRTVDGFIYNFASPTGSAKKAWLRLRPALAELAASKATSASSCDGPGDCPPSRGTSDTA